MEKLITVLTATYNRAHLLPDLYHSLCRQTCMAFDWIIIDDGSTDETESIVSQWKQESNLFNITYIKTPNGGKNRAINLGIEHTTTPFVMIVDSDDYLSDDAIEFLTPRAAKALNDSQLAGISGKRGGYCTENQHSNNTNNAIVANNLERNKYGLQHDACEVYKTDLLRSHPFVVWPGEKFVPEQIVWNQLALEGYSLEWYDKVTCIVRYQEEGLTRGVDKLMRDNPMGYAMMYKHLIRTAQSFRGRYHAAEQLIVHSILGRNPLYVLKDNLNWPTIVAIPTGTLKAIKRWIRNNSSKVSKGE